MVAPSFAQVYMVRLTAVVGDAGSLPLRTTSPAPPFSTSGPSGRSENGLTPVGNGVHAPRLVGENTQ